MFLEVEAEAPPPVSLGASFIVALVIGHSLSLSAAAGENAALARAGAKRLLTIIRERIIRYRMNGRKIIVHKIVQVRTIA